MTETQTGADTGQSVNGKAPAPAAAIPADDTGEKWLGVLVIAAGCFLLLVGIDRVTGGALSGRLFAEGDPGAG